MKLHTRPLLKVEMKGKCLLCERTADYSSSIVGLREFPICIPCAEQPEKPAGNSILQRYLRRQGGRSFLWRGEDERAAVHGAAEVSA